ncbi:MAG: alanine racemase [Erysipelotrichaceae bacterium]|nr:alanine racemase [Erysipelotrichaceae bacterium]
MFLNKLIENNPQLAEFAFKAHQRGEILPDTYLLDYDTIMENGKGMLEEAHKRGIKLYFMLKQIGRNPLIAQGLQDLGFDGCVAVDYREALLMADHRIRLGNVGHLEQVPKAALKKILAAKPELMTVYSREKIREINAMAAELNIIQPLLIRITDADSELYSGQIAGFDSGELKEILKLVEELPHICFGGLTVFPAILYNGKNVRLEPTVNMKAMERARAIANDLGYHDYNINLPSATCQASIPLIESLGGKSGEPGHGLTGTTPLHKDSEQPEKVGYVYVSEVSHHFRDKTYCYGGGHYRRSHLENALVGTELKTAVKSHISAPNDDSIDYHFELDGTYPISDTVIACFRTQIFTTRSQVAVVKGLHGSKPEIAGIYDSLGRPVKVNWQ